LTTDHFTLQGLRGGTIAESNGRLGHYLSATVDLYELPITTTANADSLVELAVLRGHRGGTFLFLLSGHS
jgi:hypothetical protein